MTQLRFTDQTIRSLKSDTRTDFWDSRTPGFGIRVGTRSKTFIAKVHNRRISIGSYPNTTLQEARRKALTVKVSAPLIVSDMTLGEAIDLFLNTHCRNYRAGTMKQAKHLLGKLKSLRSKKVVAVTTHDLNRIIDVQKVSSANHTFAMSRTFFRFCARRKLIAASPLQDQLMPNKTRSRDRVLSDHEIKCVWRATSEPTQFNTIVRLLLVTGQRKGEIAALQTSWIQNDTITLPSEIVKNHREHQFPIGAFCAAILSEAMKNMSHTNGRIFFSTTSSGAQFNNWTREKDALDEISGVTNWTLHDLRRTFRTLHARIGTPPHIAERIVNHVGSTSEVEKIYNRYQFMPEMRKAVEAYEGHLSALFAAPQQAKAG